MVAYCIIAGTIDATWLSISLPVLLPHGVMCRGTCSAAVLLLYWNCTAAVLLYCWPADVVFQLLICCLLLLILAWRRSAVLKCVDCEHPGVVGLLPLLGMVLTGSHVIIEHCIGHKPLQSALYSAHIGKRAALFAGMACGLVCCCTPSSAVVHVSVPVLVQITPHNSGCNTCPAML